MKQLFYHSKPGGPRVTVAAIVDGNSVRFGVSRCSKRDQFFKKKGRYISLGRATKSPYLTLQAPTHPKWFIETALMIVDTVKHNPELVNSR